ncbi:MAG: hypothetical protein KC620_12200 [Myxococcales bacterium]|nr:hypothetical protein [Myxococcales bacterium]
MRAGRGLRAHEPDFFAAHRARQDRLRRLHLLYRRRLAHLMASARDMLRVADEPDLIEPERASALALVQALDAHHLARIEAENAAFDAEAEQTAGRAVAAHRAQVAAIVNECEGVLIAGGHVAVLSNRLRLFEVAPLLAQKPVLAWSAGAMALTERVLLFHDSPPQGAGDAELLERGLGLVPGVIVLPHAKKRLHLDDPRRVALMARRFAPDACYPMDLRTWLRFSEGLLEPMPGLQPLSPELPEGAEALA